MVASGSMAPASKGLAQGDLCLIALALVAEAPRHGYEIIKLIEEKTAEWYSPSPNIVYPMLANLAEAGYVTALIPLLRPYLPGGGTLQSKHLRRCSCRATERYLFPRWRRAAGAQRQTCLVRAAQPNPSKKSDTDQGLTWTLIFQSAKLCSIPLDLVCW
jgi:Transcriptional regulator PadR-like family